MTAPHWVCSDEGVPAGQGCSSGHTVVGVPNEAAVRAVGDAGMCARATSTCPRPLCVPVMKKRVKETARVRLAGS